MFILLLLFTSITALHFKSYIVPGTYELNKSIFGDATEVTFEMWGAGGSSGSYCYYINGSGGNPGGPACSSGPGGSGGYLMVSLPTINGFIITVGEGQPLNCTRGGSSIIRILSSDQIAIAEGGGCSNNTSSPGKGGLYFFNGEHLGINGEDGYLDNDYIFYGGSSPRGGKGGKASTMVRFINYVNGTQPGGGGAYTFQIPPGYNLSASSTYHPLQGHGAHGTITLMY